MRPLRPDDFSVIDRSKYAQYRGNSKFLEHGKWYHVRYMPKRNVVSVPAGDNPQLERSNQGIEFSIKTFYIEGDD